MSDLPPGALGYHAVVGEFFLALRGSGLLLSPLDQELVAEWERRGVPAPVVCRGIRRGLAQLAAEKPGPVRSLRSVRFAVEDEWRAYRSGRVGDSPAPPGEEEAAARRLAQAREQLTQGAERAGRLRTVYGAALRLLLDEGAFPGSPLERAEAAILAADARLLAGWLASLPGPERTALGTRARLLAGGRRRGESRRAYRDTLRAHLLDLARQAGLTCLRGSV
jgi:hypothetical protein